LKELTDGEVMISSANISYSITERIFPMFAFHRGIDD